jgi:hypothetical protein
MIGKFLKGKKSSLKAKKFKNLSVWNSMFQS